MAGLNREIREEYPTSNLAQNSNVPRLQEDYITQVSEKIERRVTKFMSQEFSRAENCKLGAPAQIDEFLMNPLNQGRSITTLEMSRNALSINKDTKKDDSQSDPHPEAGMFQNQTTQTSGPEDGHDMVTAVHGEVTYSSPNSSPGKQNKKNHSTTQPQFSSENTPPTTEPD